MHENDTMKSWALQI